MTEAGKKRVSQPEPKGPEPTKLDSVCEKQTTAIWGCDGSSKKAFEVFVKRYMKDAYFIALGLVGNQEDALDLSQQAFMQAYRHRNRLKEKGKLFPWFYQILKNLCYSHLRKRKVRRATSLDDCQNCEPQTEICTQFDPEAIAERNEMNERVWKAISLLDEKHREVIILRHFKNLSYEQMAEMLFCNKGTVTSRLYYARKKLKEILDCEKGGKQL